MEYYMQRHYPELGQGMQWSREQYHRVVSNASDLRFNVNGFENLTESM